MLPLLVTAALLQACTGHDRVVEPEAPDDHWDQHQWESTNPYGTGEMTSSAYYGAGTSTAPSGHTPASPRMRETSHEPARPEPSNPGPSPP